jgi:hypothetical protein
VSSLPEDLALHGTLSANVVGFCRHLRNSGLGIGPDEAAEALAALSQVDVGDEVQFRSALRVCLAKSVREQQIFDDGFHAYWRVWDRAGELNRPRPDDDTGPAARQEALPVQLTLRQWLDTGDGADAEEEEETAGYSPMEAMTRRDFAGLQPAEMEDMQRVVEELARALARRLSRRRRSGRRGPIDLRRTLRRNLRRGGELMDLAFRSRRQQKLKLVVLCDVSRSMDLYSRFLLQFLYAFASAYRRLEVFGFSTSIRRLTAALREGEWSRVLDRLSRHMPEWSGGTRIGASLADFAENHSEALVDGRTAVIILSDGWDTGDTETLSSAMARIRRRAFAVLWLNPLMGNPGFRPETEGMRAALPHIDLLAPAHNAAALRDLATSLGRLQRGGVMRRPYARLAEPSLDSEPASEFPSESRSESGARIDPDVPSSARNLQALAEKQTARRR